jgi:hypothetical protein
MKRFAIVTGFVLLAGCGAKEEAAPAATESAEVAATEASAAAPAPTAGSYDVVGPDGTAGSTELNADGSYVDKDAAGKDLVKGTWAIKDGKTCFVPEGKAEECYTESARAPDGSFTATDAKGAVTKVKPKAE